MGTPMRKTLSKELERYARSAIPNMWKSAQKMFGKGHFPKSATAEEAFYELILPMLADYFGFNYGSETTWKVTVEWAQAKPQQELINKIALEVVGTTNPSEPSCRKPSAPTSPAPSPTEHAKNA